MENISSFIEYDDAFNGYEELLEDISEERKKEIIDLIEVDSKPYGILNKFIFICLIYFPALMLFKYESALIKEDLSNWFKS